jgi:hypothetical protein
MEVHHGKTRLMHKGVELQVDLWTMPGGNNGAHSYIKKVYQDAPRGTHLWLDDYNVLLGLSLPFLPFADNESRKQN